jgi:hypothetical protein
MRAFGWRGHHLLDRFDAIHLEHHQVHRQTAQGAAQQVGRVFLDLDDVGEIGWVVVGAVLKLTQIAVLPDTTDRIFSP